MRWSLVGVGLLALGCNTIAPHGNSRPRADFRPLAATCLALETSPKFTVPVVEADYWRDIRERIDRVERNLQKTLADLDRAMEMMK